MRKLSEKEINEKLMDKGIKMIGPFTNTKTKTLFGCINNHSWESPPKQVLRINGCPDCSGNRTTPLSKEIINSRLIESDRSVRMIGDYINVGTKTKFYCLSKEHVWDAKPNDILNGHGCPFCTDTRLTKDIINERLIVGNRDITMTGEYINDKTKSQFTSSCGHIWYATPRNILDGTNCPICSACGFNPGLSAWEYVFTRDGYLKYGITNDLTRRLNEHRRHGDIVLVHERYHEFGIDALDWENGVKKTYGGRYATKEQCPDGYTETLCISRLDEVIQFLHHLHDSK